MKLPMSAYVGWHTSGGYAQLGRMAPLLPDPPTFFPNPPGNQLFSHYPPQISQFCLVQSGPGPLLRLTVQLNHQLSKQTCLGPRFSITHGRIWLSWVNFPKISWRPSTHWTWPTWWKYFDLYVYWVWYGVHWRLWIRTKVLLVRPLRMKRVEAYQR